MTIGWVLSINQGNKGSSLNFSVPPGHRKAGAKQGPEVSSQATSGWGRGGCI